MDGSYLSDVAGDRIDIPRSLAALALSVLLLCVPGCALFRGRQAAPPPTPPGEVGTASWYRRGSHGRSTASGEAFDQRELTAAHPSLPPGSRVRVTNLANGRSVVLHINDRGPFAGGRVLDVSYAAARELGMLRRGTTRVRIEVLEGLPVRPTTGRARLRDRRRDRRGQASTETAR